jgi:hypothetical protein
MACDSGFIFYFHKKNQKNLISNSVKSNCNIGPKNIKFGYNIKLNNNIYNINNNI